MDHLGIESGSEGAERTLEGTAGELGAAQSQRARGGGLSSWLVPLAAGTVGALALTALHEGARGRVRNAPRMDRIGERAIRRLSRKAGLSRLGRARGKRLYRAALVGDIVSNALFYALLLAGRPRRPLLRGALGGAAAGAGALALPPLLGLGRPPRSTRTDNKLMTVAWYTIGGVCAALLSSVLFGREGARNPRVDGEDGAPVGKDAV